MKKNATEEAFSAPPQQGPSQPAQPAPAEHWRAGAEKAPPGATQRGRRSTPQTPSQGKRQRYPLSRGQKVVITLALVVAVVAALPLGAYLVLHATQHPPTTQILPTPTPTPVPTESPAQREQRFIAQMISQMSLDEELGQMLIVEFDNSVFNSDLQKEIATMHIGGTILYGTSVSSIKQAAALNARNTGAIEDGATNMAPVFRALSKLLPSMPLPRRRPLSPCSKH